MFLLLNNLILNLSNLRAFHSPYMKVKAFIKECHKLEVFKLLSIYVVSSWILLQVLAVTWQALGLPEKSVTYLIIILLVGFPIYIFLIWKFRLLPAQQSGEILEEVQHITTREFHKIYFSALGIISFLCTIAIFLIVQHNFARETELPKRVQNDKIAVLNFGNNTGDPKYDVVSQMTSDWVIHGITENHLAQVISQDVINQYNNMLKGNKGTEDENSIIRQYLKPGRIISGNFYLNNNQLVFQSTITDGITDAAIITFKSTPCNLSNPLDCIKDIQESITGFLITEGHKKLMLQEKPPKYDAYKYLLEAKATGDDAEYINLLNKSLSADPDYFEPKVLRVGYYYNIEKFKEADSLLKLIKPDSRDNKRQLNLLNMYGALLSGNNKKVYDAIKKEYNIAPFDLKSNRTAMVVALQFVNKPQDVNDIFNAIEMDSADLDNCMDCLQRIYVEALADIQLRKFPAAIAILEKIVDADTPIYLKNSLIMAYVRAEKHQSLEDFLIREELTAAPEDLQQLYFLSGKEYLLMGNSSKANGYLDKAINLIEQSPNEKTLADSYFFKKDYALAQKEFHKLHHKENKNIDILIKLAILDQMEGKPAEAEGHLKTLDQLRGEYQFGEVDYALAQYYASLEDEELVIYHLQRAVATGHLFTSQTFQNDPLLKLYADTEEFKKTMRFWH